MATIELLSKKRTGKTELGDDEQEQGEEEEIFDDDKLA